jgi:hypothetical protein
LGTLANIKGECFGGYEVRHGSGELLDVLCLAVDLFGFGLGMCECEDEEENENWNFDV